MNIKTDSHCVSPRELNNGNLVQVLLYAEAMGLCLDRVLHHSPRARAGELTQWLQQSQGKDGRFNGVVTAFRRGPYFLYTKYQEYLV